MSTIIIISVGTNIYRVKIPLPNSNLQFSNNSSSCEVPGKFKAYHDIAKSILFHIVKSSKGLLSVLLTSQVFHMKAFLLKKYSIFSTSLQNPHDQDAQWDCKECLYNLIFLK